MKTFNEFITENKTDSKTTMDYFNSEQEILGAVKKIAVVAKAAKKYGLYFDDADLVLGDVTVKTNVLGPDGFDPDTSVGDLQKAVIAQLKKLEKPAAASSKAGNFNMTRPNDNRIIIDASDEEAAKIKKLSSKDAKVRIMKRKNGNKVYVDGPGIDAFIEKLSKL